MEKTNIGPISTKVVNIRFGWTHSSESG